jgi:superfamily II DNA or RNA helicase
MKLNLKTPKGVISAMLSVRDASKRLRREILEAFTVKNPAYEQAARYSPWGAPKNIPEYIMLAHERDGELVFPRGIQPHAVLSDEAQREFKRIQWKDRTTKAPVKFPSLRVHLNDAQRALLRSFEEAEDRRMRPFRTFLFVAPTSFGKTIGQAAIAAATGQRTLILSISNLITRAWIDDLKLAYGLKPKEIGIIQQNKWRIGNQFTIASVQTLHRRKNRWIDIFKTFGTIIVDEADVISAPSINGFIMSFPARYVIGATATTSRKGGNPYLEAIFGTYTKRLIVTQSDTSTSMALQDVREIPTAFKYEYQRQNLDFHDMQEHMMADEERNALIVHHVKRDLVSGRKPLVVTNRVDHANVLFDMLKEAGVKNAGLIIGGQKTATEKVINGLFAGKCNVIVATKPAVLRGANMNPLDVLHLTMPANKTELEQIIGRIRRRAEGKTKCEVVYYLDRGVPYLFSRYKKNAVPCFRKLKVKKYLNMFMA